MRTLIAALLLAGCQSVTPAPLPLAPSVDLDRFMGDWYVVAATPTFIDPRAVDAVESYRREADGTIETTYVFRDTGFGSPLTRYTAKGFVVPDTGNAVWEIQPVWPIRTDYRIAWLAPDYSRVVIARESRDYAWIMSRTPRVPDAELDQLYDFLRAHGYEAGKLRRIPHSAAGASR